MKVLDSFSQAGEAMLLAEEGNRQIARALAASVGNAFASLKAWLAAMPTTLPPTESRR
jgi:hypothetical protein